MVAELGHLVQRVQKCSDDMKMEEERYEDVSGLGRRRNMRCEWTGEEEKYEL